MASLSACLRMTDVLVDFLIVFSVSNSSGTSACLDGLGLSVDLSALASSSSFGVTFFLVLAFLTVLPGNISRFLIGNLSRIFFSGSSSGSDFCTSPEKFDCHRHYTTQ
uniref:Uncharacterized protein n=1 Tax=Arundo donax TaxID=35708 RepID=A0A0A9H8W0_ARUDO